MDREIPQEDEGEKMKKELERLGIDEPDYCITDMRKILNIMNESREMANRTESNMRNQKKDSSSSSNNFVPDVAIKAESILETENDRPKPSCSYKMHRNSNSELPNVCDKQNIASRRKSSDDDISDDNVEKYLPRQKSKNLEHESYSSCVKNKLDPQLERKKKLNRWRINPLDSHTDQNDVPLQQPRRPPAQERVPFKLCKDAHTIEKGNKVMDQLSVHLKEMADLWLSWHGSTQLKFQWGTPIQVGTGNNGADRKSLTVASNSNEVGNISANYDRASKRKAAWVTNTAVSSSSSDDNDEISLSIRKRKRIEEANKICKALHSKEQVIQDVNYLKEKLNKKDLFSNDKLNVVDDESATNKSVNTRSSQGPNKRAVSPEMISTPRRSTSLKTNVLDKKKTMQSSSFSTQKTRGTSGNNSERSPTVSRSESTNDLLTDNDIIKELEKDSDEDNEAILNDDVVIKPLPMRNFSTRLAKQCALLKQADADRKKKLLAEQRDAERKEEEEKEKRKQDFIRRRMQEIDENLRQKEQMKRKDKEKDKWIEVLLSRNKNRVQKLKEHEKREIEKQRREILLQDNDKVQVIEEMDKADRCVEKRVTCPICNRSFPSDKIENHAAMCEQFETDSEHEQSIYSPQNSKYMVKETTKNSEAIYECNICSSFKTNNGIDYEDHVNTCIQRKQNTLAQGSSPVMINIPDSPVRSYQSVSEQRNSTVDYSDQLGSISKTQAGRKRKR